MAVSLETLDYMIALFGQNDYHIRLIEDELHVKATIRDNALHLSGLPEDCALAEKIILHLIKLLESGETLDPGKLRYIISLGRSDQLNKVKQYLNDTVAFTHKGRKIICKTAGQSAYVQAIRENSLVFGVGPAGTGKTYLATALAAVALRNKEVERIILARPAVEAGERLGFLPGDMAQKVDPYLRPLYDAIFDIIGAEAYQRLLERGCIEVAPLAFMRGRTLSNAFIILDEAQNTTGEQMKMFLTRLGQNSRCVVNGDLTQVDLPLIKTSGLSTALQVVNGLEDVAIVQMTKEDVVRSDLVQKIVSAYERFQQGGQSHD